MYEIEISNYDADHDTWITEKVHEMNQDSMHRVKSCTFSRGVSMIQAADFQLLATNPAYNKFHEHKTLVKITNASTGKIAFDGFVAKVYNDGMDASGVVQKSVSCDGCLSYLNETIQMYRKFDHVTLSEALFDNRQGYTRGLIIEHNAHVAPEKQISMGSISISTTVSFECKYESTLECIKKNILDAVPNAEIRITRNAQGQLLLNIDDGSQATTKTTPVQLADNMVSMALETDASHIVTRLIPLGAYIEGTSSSGKKVRTNQRVDISTAPVYPNPPDQTNPIKHTQNSFYIDDENAIAQYGVLVGTAVFDDLTDPEQIMNAGIEYIQNNNRIKKSYKAEVLDLSLIGLANDELEEGYVYRFYNKMIPINEDLRIQKITVDIFNAHKPTIEIGDKTEKITDVGAKQAKLIEYELPEQTAEFLDNARATATAMMQNATQGYIYIDEDLGELLIMNTPDKSTANKLWRWNSAGFGYAEAPSGTSAYDHGTFKIAMTADHALTSDFVMAASVTAQNLTITGGQINMESSSESVDKIKLRYHGASASGAVYDGYTIMQPWSFIVREETTNNEASVHWNSIRGKYGANDNEVSFEFFTETGTLRTKGEIQLYDGDAIQNNNNYSAITKSWVDNIDSWKTSTNSFISSLTNGSAALQVSYIRSDDIWLLDSNSGSYRKLNDWLHDIESRI